MSVRKYLAISISALAFLTASCGGRPDGYADWVEIDNKGRAIATGEAPAFEVYGSCSSGGSGNFSILVNGEEIVSKSLMPGVSSHLSGLSSFESGYVEKSMASFTEEVGPLEEASEVEVTYFPLSGACRFFVTDLGSDQSVYARGGDDPLVFTGYLPGPDERIEVDPNHP